MRAEIERRWAALVGLVGAATGLAVAEVGALVIAPQSSPVLAIGSLTIDLSPSWVKDAVIAVFGTGDKVFLIVMLLIALALIAAGAGVLERRRPGWGVLVFVAVGAVGAIATTTRVERGGRRPHRQRDLARPPDS